MGSIHYKEMVTPVGGILIVSTVDAVVRLAYDNDHFETVVQRAAKERRMSVSEDTVPVLEEAVKQVEAYFAGALKQFTVPTDLTAVTDFRVTVLHQLESIPYGETSTYLKLAEQLGNVNAARAVGSACSNNPVPLMIPCHRVKPSTGEVGSYLGGRRVKEFLLNYEHDVFMVDV